MNEVGEQAQVRVCKDLGSPVQHRWHEASWGTRPGYGTLLQPTAPVLCHRGLGCMGSNFLKPHRGRPVAPAGSE